MVKALTQTLRGDGSSPSWSYILFTLSALVVYKKIILYINKVVSVWQGYVGEYNFHLGLTDFGSGSISIHTWTQLLHTRWKLWQFLILLDSDEMEKLILVLTEKVTNVIKSSRVYKIASWDTVSKSCIFDVLHEDSPAIRRLNQEGLLDRWMYSNAIKSTEGNNCSGKWNALLKVLHKLMKCSQGIGAKMVAS